MALAISQAENGTRQCDRDNKGLNHDGTVDYGVFMINAYWQRNRGYSAEQLKDCKINIKVAYEIFKESKWTMWSTFHNKHYLKFL